MKHRLDHSRWSPILLGSQESRFQATAGDNYIDRVLYYADIIPQEGVI